MKARRTIRKRSRTGATAVEFALVAPAFFLVIAGSFSFGSLLMSQNVMTSAALDGVRVAALPSAPASEVIAAVNEGLSRGGLSPEKFAITLIPSDPASVPSGSQVAVLVTASADSLTWIQFGALDMNFNLTARMASSKD